MKRRLKELQSGINVPHHCARWTQADEDLLKYMWQSRKYTLSYISKLFNRTTYAINRKLRLIGAVSKHRK